jgi:predicted nucleic acid-binding protein
MEKAFYETSMFLEPFNKSNRLFNRKRNEKILALLKGLIISVEEHFTPVTSVSVLGEIELILRDTEKIRRFSQSPDYIRSIINDIIKRFEIVAINEEAIHLASELIKKDPRGIKSMDALNFACAVENNCKSFAFIDSELKNNKFINEIAKERGIKLNPW